MHCINDTLLERAVLHTQHLNTLAIIPSVHACFWPIATLQRFTLRHSPFVLWECLANHIHNLPVAKVAFCYEESLIGCVRLLDRRDVRESEVSDIDPEVVAGWREFGFGGAGEEVAEADVGGVDLREGGKGVDYWAEDEGWVALV